MIEDIDKELAKVIEDFNRAAYVEVLRQADETSKLSFFSICRWLFLKGLA